MAKTRTNKKTIKRTNKKTIKRTNKKTIKRTNRKTIKRTNKKTNKKINRKTNKKIKNGGGSLDNIPSTTMAGLQELANNVMINPETDAEQRNYANFHPRITVDENIKQAAKEKLLEDRKKAGLKEMEEAYPSIPKNIIEAILNDAIELHKKDFKNREDIGFTGFINPYARDDLDDGFEGELPVPVPVTRQNARRSL
jgi:hypothetical protein